MSLNDERSRAWRKKEIDERWDASKGWHESERREDEGRKLRRAEDKRKRERDSKRAGVSEEAAWLES